MSATIRVRILIGDADPFDPSRAIPPQPGTTLSVTLYQYFGEAVGLLPPLPPKSLFVPGFAGGFRFIP
jgi:hypothetical protein